MEETRKQLSENGQSKIDNDKAKRETARMEWNRE